MLLIKPSSSASIKQTQNFLIPHEKVLFRSFGTWDNKTICQCGVVLPEMNRMIDLFNQRKLRDLYKEVACPYFKNFDFKQHVDCELADAIHEVASLGLSNCKDVVHVGHHFVMLSALKPIPERDIGDLTGDHGKQIAKFLKDCISNNLIGPIGSVFDIGGQNASAVSLISKLFNHEYLPSLIVDINSITPAISDYRNNVKYIIDDVHAFFSSEQYENHVNGIVNEMATLVIFNNALNVLEAEKGWSTLKAAWEKLRPKDYLVISGLAPEQFERAGLSKHREIDGIIEFHSNTGFYKSALSHTFFEFVEHRLVKSSVLFEETFRFPIEGKSQKLMDVSGRRLLTLKKL